ncbi:hypothetical protein ACFSCX_17585 [Bacillus salitolerans]|uniref:Secreted protein n=1 Tax=Bacillus salitolerans TaxID=1437434 RepID=A0ABW4LUL7_9BACI
MKKVLQVFFLAFLVIGGVGLTVKADYIDDLMSCYITVGIGSEQKCTNTLYASDYSGGNGSYDWYHYQYHTVKNVNNTDMYLRSTEWKPIINDGNPYYIGTTYVNNDGTKVWTTDAYNSKFLMDYNGQTLYIPIGVTIQEGASSLRHIIPDDHAQASTYRQGTFFYLN